MSSLTTAPVAASPPSQTARMRSLYAIFLASRLAFLVIAWPFAAWSRQNAGRDPTNRSREDKPPRSEAIRRLVERGLASELADAGKPRRKGKP